MPRPRFDKLPPERRSEILDTAGREFAEHGFDGASLNHILEAAGVSKGAAYYYFDDKADLFGTVARRTLDHIMGEAGFSLERLDKATFWPKIAELYRQQLAHAQEAPWMFGMGNAIWRLSEGAREDAGLADLFKWMHSWIGTIAVQGQELGAIRRDVPAHLIGELFQAFDQVIDGWTAEHLEKDGPAETETMVMRLLGGLGRMLEPPPEGRT